MSGGPASQPTPGRFVVFEGGEGSGKSTQAARLAHRLGAVLTREPGGTDFGRRIRAIVLDQPGDRGLDPRAEALLLAADRAQHVAQIVRPALERGDDVVSDRFTGSTLAYQGWGRGLDVDDLRWICGWASGGLEPDLIVLLEVDSVVAAERIGEPRDRVEAAGADFHRRVAAGYRALAAADERWVVVDGSGSADLVEEAVWAAYRRRAR